MHISYYILVGLCLISVIVVSVINGKQREQIKDLEKLNDKFSELNTILTKARIRDIQEWSVLKEENLKLKKESIKLAEQCDVAEKINNEITKKLTSLQKEKSEKFSLSKCKLIVNNPATIVFYNGKKYIAKRQKGDKYDMYKGVMMAILKAQGIEFSDLEELVKNAKVEK